MRKDTGQLDQMDGEEGKIATELISSTRDRKMWRGVTANACWQGIE
jgi:hypothetical protein